jgi:hypothetical protein
MTRWINTLDRLFGRVLGIWPCSVNGAFGPPPLDHSPRLGASAHTAFFSFR